MMINLSILFYCIVNIHGKHFNGGTITWAPIDPYTTASSISVTITQTYSWTYPYVKCLTNVPASSGFSSSNLVCVVECAYDGNYSANKISTSTDCISTSTALGMMTSQRSNNITLGKDAHFYLAYVGEAWIGLNYPLRKNQEWSIVTYIDLRRRPDGFINTPPVATVVSPQYAIVNRTIQINIPVSDVNVGDDVRCRWSTYTDGYRRRKRSYDEKQFLIRKKRSCPMYCGTTCVYTCSCTDCSSCAGTTCTGSTCSSFSGCTSSTTVVTTTQATTTTTAVSTTTIETAGTLRSTSSYPVRQAINECGDICYPDNVPSGTTLNGCTISFTGTRANTWYAIAIQVEDFIDSISTVAMSSVPVQLLVYVMGEPKCSTKPLILPLKRCFEVQIGVTITFDIHVMNLCNPAVSNISDIMPSGTIDGMVKGSLTKSPTNSSLSYVRFTWTPQVNQLGYVEQCTTAYTTEQVQSDQYCVTFTVKSTSELCVTTTTTSTTTSSSTATTMTTTTETTTTTTTSPTSTSTTTTSTTSTTSTTTTTTLTTSTTTSVTTTTVTTATTTAASKDPINWPLIVGLLLFALLLSSCCCACCIYRYCWPPGERRRRRRHRKNDGEIGAQEQQSGSRHFLQKVRQSRAISRLFQASPLSATDGNYNSLQVIESTTNNFPLDLTMTDVNPDNIDNVEKRPTSFVSITRVKCLDLDETDKTKDEQNDKNIHISNIPHLTNRSVHVTKLSKFDKIQEETEQISRKKTNESTLEMHQISNRSKTASHHSRLDDSVTVKKLSKTVTSAQP